MSAERRFKLAAASNLADRLVEQLQPATERIIVAGSIRRLSPGVKDIEIVAIPIEAQVFDLFGEPTGTLSAVDGKLADMQLLGYISRTPPEGVILTRKPAWGAKHKKFWVAGMAVDLFLTNPDSWGLQLLIRTGPWQFSKQCVTQRNKGGLLPDDLYSDEGSLWRRRWGQEPEHVPVREEDDMFAILGEDVIPPEQRQ